MTTAENMPGFDEEKSVFGLVCDEEMFDMTSLSSRRTGVPGTIYMATAQGQHGPRIKWYPDRPSRDAPCLVVTLEVPPHPINHGLSLRIARQGEPALRWAAQNRTALVE